MARILLGVTGGIAAYKACTLVRLLVRAGHEVHPVLTASAERFVAAETFAALARRPPSDDPYPHLGRFDLLVVAPLTANTLARLAHGLADDVLTEAALAHSGPVLVAPAMNTRMWQHPATQANVATLRSRGVLVVGPDRRRARRGGGGRRPHGRARGDPEPDRTAAAPRRRAARREACRGVGRGHTRAARRGAVRREPLVGPHGRRARRGGGPSRRRRHPARGQPRRARARGNLARARRRRRRTSSARRSSEPMRT